MAGLITVVALALLLLWRVYVHHSKAEPYDDDEPMIVRMQPQPPVKFAAEF